jgi:NTE family protein
VTAFNRRCLNLSSVIILFCIILFANSFGAPKPFTITIPGPADTLEPDLSFLPHPQIRTAGITLALSGGGARGFAQVGALKALEDAQIPIRLMVGTSTGALIGGLYATGYSATDLQRLILTTDWQEFFFDRPTRTSLFLTQKRLHGRHIIQIRLRGLHPEIPLGLTAGHDLTLRLMGLLERSPYYPWQSFDHLAIPFRAVATDLFTGRKVVFRQGNLLVALRSSMSFPLIFTPFETDSMLLVDGGIWENIPVKTAREEGGGMVVTVNTTAPTEDHHEPQIPWEIADRVTTIMQQDENRENLALADVVITPAVAERNSTDFSNPETIIDAGYQAARDKIPDIRRLLNQSSPTSTNDTIAFSEYRFTSTGTVPQELKDIIQIPAPGSITVNALTEKLTVCYNSGHVIDTRASWDGSTLSIHTGFTSMVRVIEFQGNTLFTKSYLLSLMSQIPGQLLNLNQGRDDLRRILSLYRSTGATQARIDTVTFSVGVPTRDNDSTGTLLIALNEGVITDITVEGLKRVHRWGVLREFPLRVGAIFLIDAAERGIRQIYGSELFDNAFMVTERTPGGVRIHIQVKERESRLLRWGARFDLERKGQTFLEFLDDNLLGIHARLSLFGKYGEKDEHYRASLISDRMFKSYLSLEVAGYYRREEWSLYDNDHHPQSGYDFERTGLTSALGVQTGRWGQLSGGFRAERVLSSYIGQEHDMGLGMIELRAAIDTQDRTPFPTHGHRFSFLYQSSGKYLTSDAGFVKTDLQADSYLEIVRRHVVGLHFQWGAADATIPHSEKFRLGGQNSLLAFHEGELVGNARINFGLDYRFDLISRFLAEAYISGHYTAGGVWNGAEYRIRAEDFMQGIGVSFSLNTVLGPITLTWGRLLPSHGYRESNMFYLSAGHEF